MLLSLAEFAPSSQHQSFLLVVSEKDPSCNLPDIVFCQRQRRNGKLIHTLVAQVSSYENLLKSEPFLTSLKGPQIKAFYKFL